MRTQERIFPKHVKLLLLSQSDFSLPGPMPVALGMFLIRVLGAIVVGSSQSFVGWNWFLRKHGVHHHHASQDSFFPDSSQKPISSFTAVFKTFLCICMISHSFTEFTVTGFIQSFLVCCSLRPNSIRTPNSVLGGHQKKTGLAEEVRLHIFRLRPRRGTGDPKNCKVWLESCSHTMGHG